MKRYIGKRDGETTADPVLVMVVDRDDIGIDHHAALRHVIRHSPGGFNWGYGGSGPAELARCILLDFLGTERVSSALYQEFKARMIAPLGQADDWEISEAAIRAFLASRSAQAIDAWLDEEAFPTLPDVEEGDEGAGADLTAWFEAQDARNRAVKARYAEALPR